MMSRLIKTLFIVAVTALHSRLFSWDKRSAATDNDIILAEGM